MKLDRNLDRNADNHQRTAANTDEHKVTLQATGGIHRNTGERCSSYPPSDPYTDIACRKTDHIQTNQQLRAKLTVLAKSIFMHEVQRTTAQNEQHFCMRHQEHSLVVKLREATTLGWEE